MAIFYAIGDALVSKGEFFEKAALGQLKAFAKGVEVNPSAALLDRFFQIREGKEQPFDMLMDAFKLYNDWKFLDKADKIEKELSGLDPKSKIYKTKKESYKAMVENILTEMLKPKLG